MLLETPTPDISQPFSPEVVSRLQALEKKRRFVENRMLLWLIVPVLWAIPFIIAYITDSQAIYIFGGIWIFIALFGMGTYIHVILPSNEEISNQYKKAVIPDLIRIAGGEGEYSLTHSLKVESFLKSGLYHANYSHFERADSIVGNYRGVKFGLYELAVQTTSSLTMGPIGPGTQIYTNVFYGWVLHVPIRAMAGKTYIIPRVRKTKHESDDWIKATKDFFDKEHSGVFITGDGDFDSTFIVYTNSENDARSLSQPSFIKFLLVVFNQSANAPAFSFTGNRAAMHIGISDSAFDRQTGQCIYPPETDRLMKKVRFFCAITAALFFAGSQKGAV
ncbi:MAG: DUF3137 domain-containing protein [Bacteroidota bacterium]|nr:DUF3137 domain-containing protein [Bacteroidota bacterium]